MVSNLAPAPIIRRWMKGARAVNAASKTNAGVTFRTGSQAWGDKRHCKNIRARPPLLICLDRHDSSHLVISSDRRSAGRCRVQYEKLLTPSRPERHDHG